MTNIFGPQHLSIQPQAALSLSGNTEFLRQFLALKFTLTSTLKFTIRRILRNDIEHILRGEPHEKVELNEFRSGRVCFFCNISKQQLSIFLFV